MNPALPAAESRPGRQEASPPGVVFSGSSRLDPLTEVPIPSKESGASKPEKDARLRDHLSAVQAISSREVSGLAPLPLGLQSSVAKVVGLSPRDHLHLQWDRLHELRRVAASAGPHEVLLLEKVHPSVRQVLSAASPRGLRIHLIFIYLRRIRHPDAEALYRDLFEGFPLVGDIPVSPVAPLAAVRTARIDEDALRVEAREIAPSLLLQHSRPPRDGVGAAAESEIFSQTVGDIALGRMGPLLPPGADGAQPPYTRRFGVQQTSSHGASKLRCIDDFAQSRVNDAVTVDRRIRMGAISDFVQVAQAMRRANPTEALHVMKSDFKAAYRSCPIHPDHVPLANILIRNPVTGEVLVTSQRAMPFGAVSAVYAWDRLGEALTAILREVFLFPASRYVDDLFMPTWASTSSSSRNILLQVIEIFGAVLSPEKTPAPSRSMPVLGVLVSLESGEVSLQIEPERTLFWLKELRRLVTVSRPVHMRDLASRMAGRLEFACSAVWGAFPRARLGGLYRVSMGAPLDNRVLSDLGWLEHLLEGPRVTRALALSPEPVPPIVMYTDASGSPRNGLGVVLMDGGEILWTSSTCPPFVLENLRPRKTQINPLEVLGVVLGLWTFAEKIRGRRLLVLIDNQSALGAVKKGRSQVPDINEIVFLVRDLCNPCSSPPAFRWVPSELNWADAPSRGEPPAAGTRVEPVTRWHSIPRW